MCCKGYQEVEFDLLNSKITIFNWGFHKHNADKKQYLTDFSSVLHKT